MKDQIRRKMMENNDELNPLVIAFAETDDIEGKLNLIPQMYGQLSQRDLDVIYDVLDLAQQDGDPDEQLWRAEQSLRLQDHFDGGRLR